MEYVIQVSDQLINTYINVESSLDNVTVSCTDLDSPDGGILIYLILDSVLSAIIFGASWLFWEWWIEKKQIEADDIIIRDTVEDDYLSMSSHAAAKPRILEDDRPKLKWYKFYYQIMSMKETVLKKHQGEDGILYVHFSKHLLVLSLVICVLAAGCLMPVYVFLGDREDFTFTSLTILNLAKDSDWLWLPTLISPLILMISVLVMENYRSELAIDAPHENEHAVVIQGTEADKDQLRAYLREMGMEDQVVDIQYVYDVEELYDILSDMKEAGRMQLRYKDLEWEGEEGAEELTITHSGCLCCLSIEEPAVMYWTQERLELQQRFIEECSFCLDKRVPKLFIVWKSPTDSQRFLNKFKPTRICRLLSDPALRSGTNWSVARAPVHYDIMWENYAISPTRWWARVILVNIVLLFFVVFFTTPIIIIEYLYNLIVDSEDDTTTSMTLWSEFATIILLLMIEAALPEIVNLTCNLERHRTKTNQNYWCVWKVFIYLLISELFMPAFGYYSLAGFLDGYFSNGDLLSNWTCIFSAYTTAFMCKILLSAALIGRAIELFNPSGFCRYLYWLNDHETKREYQQIFTKMRDRFNIGYNYGKVVAYSAIFISFGVICPPITLFGVLFVFVKYSVDKYQLIYFHRPCDSYGTLSHEAATTYVVFSACLLQIFMFIFDVLYLGLWSGQTYVSLCVLVLIISIFYYDLWTSFVRWLFPERGYLQYDKNEKEYELVDAYRPPYLNKARYTTRGGIPKVKKLESELMLKANKISVTYGATKSTDGDTDPTAGETV